MYRQIFFVLVPFLLLSGCKEPIKEKEKEIPKENSIALISFRMNDSLGFNTSGWGVKDYYFLDLLNDSVFLRNGNSYYYDLVGVDYKTGIIKGISKNKNLVNGLIYLDSIKPGFLEETNKSSARLHVRQYCIQRNQYGVTNYYFFKDSTFDQYEGPKSNLELLFEFLLELNNRKDIKSVGSKFNFDEVSIMYPMSIANGFNKLYGAPVTSQIKFTPPDSLKTKIR